MSPSIDSARRSPSAKLFLSHAWRTRWGAIAALAGASVLCGLCMVALFITPAGVPELSTLQLMGMAGLFLLPAITVASLHWDRRNRGMAWRPGTDPRAPGNPNPPMDPDIDSLDDASREVAELSADLDRVLATPWIMPDPASPRGNAPSRHRRRIRPLAPSELRAFLSTGRD